MGTYYVIKIVDPFQHNYTPFIVQNKIDSLLNIIKINYINFSIYIITIDYYFLIYSETIV